MTSQILRGASSVIKMITLGPRAGMAFISGFRAARKARTSLPPAPTEQARSTWDSGVGEYKHVHHAPVHVHQVQDHGHPVLRPCGTDHSAELHEVVGE